MDMHSNGMGRHGSVEAKAAIADRLLEAMKLGGGDTLVDLGSGDGYYSSRFAETCAKVVAVDASAEVLKSDYYRKLNIETVGADVCAWARTFAWESVAQVFFSNSFHDMRCQEELLATFSAKLRPGARLNLVEFHLDTPFGPPRSIRFSKEQLKALVEPRGFEEKISFDLGTHYFISFEKAKK
ncbi:MAG: class I SAM-dependent methyltransferase [Treponema sp.]|nr:class I SAM-dependent methyltransferase [Treponema sp.]